MITNLLMHYCFNQLSGILKRCENRKFLSVFLLLTFGLLVLLIHCHLDIKNISYHIDENGNIVFANSLVSLVIESSTKMNVRYQKDGQYLSLLVPTERVVIPPHFLIVNGQQVDNFQWLPEKTKVSSTHSEFGEGKQLQVFAITDGPQQSIIQKEINILLLEKHPDVALINTVYQNLNSQGSITINSVYNNAFQLDRKQVNPQKLSYDFWNFSGFGEILGGRHDNIRANVLPVSIHTNIINDAEVISGVPLVDIWAPEMGIAIACVEKRAKILKMPLQVDEKGLVNISIKEEPEVNLKSGESYSALRTVIIVHSLDFYNALKRYAELMAVQGITPKTCPDFASDPFWCNWGYRRDWKLSHGLDRLDEFKTLGIKAITIDDGWFDVFGDWFPSPGRFPDGDQQLKEWIDSLHANGLKVVLWWVPGIGGPLTIREHPDWIILDKEGQKTTIHWQNSHMLCPSLPEVIEHHRELTRKFIVDYGVDGFKMDGIYIAPPCYNPAHHHKVADESYSDYQEIFKAIYTTAMKLKPDGDFVLGMCPCGSLCSPYYLQWGNRPVVADPPRRAISTRYRIKAYKALLGPHSIVDNDFHERYNDYFPVEFGAGGLMTTKYTTLSDFEFDQFKKWYNLYNQFKISSGEYLNLYDIAYDVPETYVVKKNGSYFYTFLKPAINGPEGIPWDEDLMETRKQMLIDFEKELEKFPLWQGRVELRGLENKQYSVYDIESGKKLGVVEGPTGRLTISFKDHLIVRAVVD